MKPANLFVKSSDSGNAGLENAGLGSARVPRAGFGVPPKPLARRDAGQHTRDACAPRKNASRFFWGGLLAAAALAFAGCGGNHDHAADHAGAGHDHAAHSGAETGQGVSFKEGRGLRLSPEVIRALAIKTEDATERPLAAELSASAQILATAPRILATARVPEADAAALEKASPAGAKLLLADRSATQATRFVDLVFEIENPPAPAPASPPPRVGGFVTLALAGDPATVLAVPRSAVLETAAGPFVYVVNGDAFLRTSVRTGARSASLVEITDGLYAGDVVAVSPVEQLWLAELRLTKGGGHSH